MARGEFHRRLEVRAESRTVATDVGEDDRRCARRCGPTGDVERSRARLVEPAFGRDPAIALVDADRDTARVARAGPVDQIGVAHRGGAEYGPVRSRFEDLGDRVEIAQTAPDLNRDIDRGTDRGDDRTVRPGPSGGPVQIDHVQTRATLGRPALRHGDRIIAIGRLCVEVPLQKSNALPAAQIDRRNHLEMPHPDTTFRTKLRSIRIPTSWLFSGWNWVAKRLSRATAEVNSSSP